MEHLVIVGAVLAVATLVTGLLLPALNRRARTPEERAERERQLRDELAAWGQNRTVA